ncbi:N-acetylmuramoyl-L-alanine amidase [Bacillus sp. JJ1562]|uniref:N-acetylmuramoyl-L-alanine amidase n=1 Tax=Bacillus sp. JJ1562 TaxID=3122960 RepID=UPI0030019641
MKIVIDAGHAGFGITPGKRTPDGSMHEWDVNSKVAEYAREYLLQYRKTEVLFTHDPTGKVDTPLHERVKKANDGKVDVFVSIHANAFGDTWNDASGIETYTNTSRTKEATELAHEVQKKVIKETKRIDRGVKTANFYILRETKMTAILVECGFMTNKVEAELLKNDEYRRKCAQGIVGGLAKQYNLYQIHKEVGDLPLKHGDKGEGVRVLHYHLASLGYTQWKNAEIDVFGDWTKDALFRFQRDQKLRQQEGIYDFKTAIAFAQVAEVYRQHWLKTKSK